MDLAATLERLLDGDTKLRPQLDAGFGYLGQGRKLIGGERVQLLFHDAAAEGILDFEVLFVLRDETDDFLVVETLDQLG